jgi:hypothetical protein
LFLIKIWRAEDALIPASAPNFDDDFTGFMEILAKTSAEVLSSVAVRGRPEGLMFSTDSNGLELTNQSLNR